MRKRAAKSSSPRTLPLRAMTALGGAAWRTLRHNPRDVLAGCAAVVVVGAIVVNALALQAGRHPSPMFGSNGWTPMPEPVNPNLLPRPRPADVGTIPDKTLDSRLFEAKPVDIKPARATEKADARPAVDAKPPEKAAPSDPIGNLVRASITQPSPRPPAAVPATDAPSRRVASIQRALVDIGYSPFRTNGVAGPEFQAAIMRFERERRWPVTGQVSPRLMRELALISGRPID